MTPRQSRKRAKTQNGKHTFSRASTRRMQRCVLALLWVFVSVRLCVCVCLLWLIGVSQSVSNASKVQKFAILSGVSPLSLVCLAPSFLTLCMCLCVGFFDSWRRADAHTEAEASSDQRKIQKRHRQALCRQRVNVTRLVDSLDIVAMNL